MLPLFPFTIGDQRVSSISSTVLIQTLVPLIIVFGLFVVRRFIGIEKILAVFKVDAAKIGVSAADVEGTELLILYVVMPGTSSLLARITNCRQFPSGAGAIEFPGPA